MRIGSSSGTPDIQGMGTGINISAASGLSRVPQRIENSYLRNQTNLAMGTMFTSSYTANGIQPRQVIVTDTTFVTPSWRQRGAGD